MPALYDTLESYKTIQVMSQNQVRDVQFVSAVTKPTGIQFYFSIDYYTWQTLHADTILDPIVGILEGCATNGHVVAGNGVQDLDKQGLLADFVDLVVELDRSATSQPPLDGTVEIPMTTVEAYATDPNIARAAGLVDPEVTCQQEYARLVLLG